MKLSLIAVILLDMDNTDICIMGQIPGCDCLIENPNVDHFNNGGFEIPFDTIPDSVKNVCPTYSRQDELNSFMEQTKSKYPLIKVGFIGDGDSSEIGIYEIEIEKEDLELLEIVQNYKDELMNEFQNSTIRKGYSGGNMSYPELLDELLCFCNNDIGMDEFLIDVEDGFGLEEYGYMLKE